MRKAALPPRQRILAAARSIFADRGYAGASVQDIVERARVTKPTLYYYFKNKAGLFQAIIDEAFDERYRLMREAAERHQSLEGQLTEILQTLFRYARDHRDLTRISFSMAFAAPGEAPFHTRCLEKRKRNFDFVHGLFKKGLKTRQLDTRYDSRELAMFFFSNVLLYALSQVIPPPHGAVQAKPERIVELFLNGAASKKRRRVS